MLVTNSVEGLLVTLLSQCGLERPLAAQVGKRRWTYNTFVPNLDVWNLSAPISDCKRREPHNLSTSLIA